MNSNMLKWPPEKLAKLKTAQNLLNFLVIRPCLVVVVLVVKQDGNLCLMLQENEKLYLQLRTQKTKSKANEEAMFNENQRLLSALAFTKWVQ